jgi:hypothetical protein
MRYLIHSLLLLLSLFAIEGTCFEGKLDVVHMAGQEVSIDKMIGEKN